MRRQKKNLEDKESKLLELFKSVEGIMEDFEDQVKTATGEIMAFEQRAAKTAERQKEALEEAKQELKSAKDFASAGGAYALPGKTPPAGPHTAKPMTVDSTRYGSANEVRNRAERVVLGGEANSFAAAVKSVDGMVFQRIIEEAKDEAANVGEASNKHKNIDEILALSQEGKTQAQIAQMLGITLSEVTLVLDLKK